MSDVIREKNQRIDELQHDKKSTKLVELQEEAHAYQRECLRLRNVAELAMTTLIQNGLYSKLKSNKKVRNFAKTLKL